MSTAGSGFYKFGKLIPEDLPKVSMPTHAAFNGFIKALSESFPDHSFYSDIARAFPVFSRSEWKAWYLHNKAQIDPLAIARDTGATWLEPEKGGFGNGYVPAEEKAIVQFWANWDGPCVNGAGWQEFTNTRKPFRTTPSWMRLWNSNRQDFIERINKLRSKRGKQPLDASAKRGPSVSMADTGGMNKRPKTVPSANVLSDGSNVQASSSRQPALPDKTSYEATKAALKKMKAVAQSKEPVKKRQPPSLKQHLTMIEFLVENGDEPALSDFIDFCEQESNRDLRFNEWMKLYRDNKDELVASASSLRGMIERST